jgi:TetR/AcrR family tetracycline transcriptional repressor
MTKMRWTPDDVIDAAFATLEAEGFEKLSLRGVARTLGAHLNSVSWYVKTKQTLIETMADTIVGTVRTDDLPADAVDRVRTVAHRYRAAMPAHRDGARRGLPGARRGAVVLGDRLLHARTDPGAADSGRHADA